MTTVRQRAPAPGAIAARPAEVSCRPRRTVLAYNVPNGIDYIVLYQIDYLQQRIRFRVHH
jgi:hypothetical protein